MSWCTKQNTQLYLTAMPSPPTSHDKWLLLSEPSFCFLSCCHQMLPHRGLFDYWNCLFIMEGFYLTIKKLIEANIVVTWCFIHETKVNRITPWFGFSVFFPHSSDLCSTKCWKVVWNVVVFYSAASAWRHHCHGSMQKFNDWKQHKLTFL